MLLPDEVLKFVHYMSVLVNRSLELEPKVFSAILRKFLPPGRPTSTVKALGPANTLKTTYNTRNEALQDEKSIYYLLCVKERGNSQSNADPRAFQSQPQYLPYVEHSVP